MAGEVIATVGGVVSRTVTVTAEAVPWLPAASRATAVRVCVPTVALALFQATAYGAAVTSGPRFAPSSLNWTPATPTLSVAVAEMVSVPAVVDPDAGAVMETVGEIVSIVGGVVVDDANSAPTS